jgi:DNA-nicking Smr family endonuclease
VEEEKPDADEVARAADEAVRAHLRSLVQPEARFEVRDNGATIEGWRLDVDRAAFRRLKRGEFPIDDTCDLHGRTAGEAREYLKTFVEQARSRGDRVVLVVHGRGNHSPGGYGILRGEMAAWLSQSIASVHVAAFATAQADHGGEGALYVWLRLIHKLIASLNVVFVGSLA